MALAALFANRMAPSGPSRGPVPSLQKALPDSPPKDEVSTPQQLAVAIERSVGDAERLIVVAFVTSFAPPSAAVVASLKKLQQTLANVEVYTVSVDSPGGGALADEHAIVVTPTIRLYVQSKIVHEMRTISQDLIHPFVLKWSKKAKGAAGTKGHEV